MKGGLSSTKQYLRVNTLQPLSLATYYSKEHHSTADSKEISWNLQCFTVYG